MKENNQTVEQSKKDFEASGFNKKVTDVSEVSEVCEASTEENIPPPSSQPQKAAPKFSKARPKSSKALLKSSCHKYISLATSWEETDEIDDQLFDKFAQSQTRTDYNPVVVNVLNRRVIADRLSLRCPHQMRIRYENHESFRRQFISKFGWSSQVPKYIDESNLKSLADAFLNHVKQTLQERAVSKKRLSLGLNSSNVRSRVFEFTTPGAPYYVQLEDDGECVLVPDPASSPYAIIDIERGENSETQFREKLGDNVKFQFVPLNYCQRTMTGKYLNKKSRLIRFDTKVQKIMSSNIRESPICVTGSFDYSKTHEAVFIQVRFNSMSDRNGLAILKLKQPKDVQFAENVLLRHGLFLRYSEDKFGVNPTEMILRNIPSFVDNDDYLTWFVNEVFVPNRIGFEKVQFETIPIRRLTEKTSVSKTNLYPERIMAYELMRLVCKEKLRPDFEIKTLKELNQMVRNPHTLPFRLVDHVYDNGDKTLTAHFYDENVELGKELGSLCLLNMPDTDFMRFTSSQILPARIFPIYRKMLPMSRSIRSACKVRVEEVEKNLIKWLKIDATNHHPDSLESRDTERNSAKIIDDYVNDSEDGFTGIEGWPPSLVDEFVGHLKNAFAPQVFDCTDQNEVFLYGIGEAYVRRFVEKKPIIVDFDRYRSKLTYYGDASDEFLVHLEHFDNLKNSSCFQACFQICESQFHGLLLKILTNDLLAVLGERLKAKITIDRPAGNLIFNGTCRGYEMMVDLVNSMKREICTALCKDSLNYSQCPVCQCTISTNFYRLEDCGHTYCYSCMNNMVRSFVGNAQFDMKCCFEKCGKLITPGDVRRIILGGENRVKLLDAEKLHLLNSRAIESIVTRPGSTFKVCKTIDCTGILQSSRGSGQTNAKCVNCGSSYCIKCLEEPHPQIESCEVYERIRRDAEYSLKTYTSTTGDEKFRRCPTENCKAVIEKGDGCNHVECPYCHCHFCWICLLKTEKMSDLYKHMTDAHGGTGGEWRMDVDDIELFADADETLDTDFQNFLLAPGQP